jgi:hypothetical protein
MFAQLVLFATIEVVRQPQPPFRHVQENELGVRVIEGHSQLGAGLGIRSVHLTIIHKRASSLSNLIAARHLNAALCRLFPIS